MQIPILKGAYTTAQGDFLLKYPVNMYPVAFEQQISNGYLKCAEGMETYATGPGTDRGGLLCQGRHFRVMGNQFCEVGTGEITAWGAVGSSIINAQMDYSFTYVGIVSNGLVYLFDPARNVVTQITDPDLGEGILDIVWVDGYFMMTDGTSLIVTDLNDPFSVNPLKYGSSELDPDPITGLLKLRGEIYALNRNTIEVFNNVGGSGFPFARVSSASIPKGCISAQAKCLFAQTFAFVGGGRNEALGVYLATGGATQKISSREIDMYLGTLTESDYPEIVLEQRTFDDRLFLYVHTPAKTWVFDALASEKLGTLVWFELNSNGRKYRARNFVIDQNKWYCGDPTSNTVGIMTTETPTHYGDITPWQFDTGFQFNNQNGVIIDLLEITGLPGLTKVPGVDPTCYMSVTDDGRVWSQEWPASIGTSGQDNRKMSWKRCGLFRGYRGFRFRGANDAPFAAARLEATARLLNR